MLTGDEERYETAEEAAAGPGPGWAPRPRTALGGDIPSGLGGEMPPVGQHHLLAARPPHHWEDYRGDYTGAPGPQTGQAEPPALHVVPTHGAALDMMFEDLDRKAAQQQMFRMPQRGGEPAEGEAGAGAEAAGPATSTAERLGYL